MSTAAFTAGAKKAIASTKSLVSSFKGLGSVAGGLAGGASAAGLAMMVKESIALGDETAELASKLGVSTEALTRLQYAAKLTGSNMEDVGGAIQKLNVNLGKGGKGVDAALASIGLTAEQLKAADPATAFAMIADGIKQIDSPADRAATIMALMGKQGLTLTNTLASGGDAIKRFAAESDALGFTLDAKTADGISKTADGMDRMEAASTGMQRAVAVGLLPTIDGLTQAFAGGGKELNSWITWMTELGAKFSLPGMIAHLSRQLTGARAELMEWDAFFSVGAGGGVAEDKYAAAAELRRSMDRKPIVDTPAAEKTKIAVIDDETESIKEQKNAVEDLIRSRQKELDEIAKAAELKQKMIDDENNDIIRERESELADIQSSMQRMVDAAKTPLQEFMESESEVAKALQAGWIGKDQADLLGLQGQMDLLNSQEDTPAAGSQRVAALEKGSAAAFSASFGSDPRSKREAELLRLTQEQNKLMKSIDAKLTPTKI
jgi:hypothetical protein